MMLEPTALPGDANLRLRIASDDDAAAIVALRRKAYRVANGHKIEDESFLDWNETDVASGIILIEDAAGTLLSSIRTIPLFTQQEMEQMFDIRVKEEVPVPTIAVDRACTDPTYRRLGFTGVNRLIMISACRSSGFASLTLTMNDSASRLGFLRKAGYIVQEADLSHRGDDSMYTNSGGVMFCQLQASNFDFAINYSLSQLGESLSMFSAEQIEGGAVVDALCAKWAMANTASELAEAASLRR